jgi:hypothetical protein
MVEFTVARTVGASGKRVTAISSPNVVTSTQNTYVTLCPQLKPLQQYSGNYNTLFAEITRSQLLRYVIAFLNLYMKYVELHKMF